MRHDEADLGVVEDGPGEERHYDAQLGGAAALSFDIGGQDEDSREGDGLRDIAETKNDEASGLVASLDFGFDRECEVEDKDTLERSFLGLDKYLERVSSLSPLTMSLSPHITRTRHRAGT